MIPANCLKRFANSFVFSEIICFAGENVARVVEEFHCRLSLNVIDKRRWKTVEDKIENKST